MMFSMFCISIASDKEVAFSTYDDKINVILSNHKVVKVNAKHRLKTLKQNKK